VTVIDDTEALRQIHNADMVIKRFERRNIRDTALCDISGGNIGGSFLSRYGDESHNPEAPAL